MVRIDINFRRHPYREVERRNVVAERVAHPGGYRSPVRFENETLQVYH